MAYGVIYKITDTTNGKPYIGQTTRTVEERFKEHTESPYLIGIAIRAHGVENFTIEVIAECETQEELNAQEIRFIAEYDSMAPKGYNCTSGGEGGLLCEETKAKLRESANKFYEEHPERRDEISAEQTRRFEDPEERAKQAERTRKSFEDPERAAKHSESQKKRFERQEERDKIAAAVTERFSDPAERAAQSERIKKAFQKPGVSEAISARQKKRFEDPAERQKVADGVNRYYAEHGGRKQSDETCKKISIKRKAYWRRKRMEKLLPIIVQENSEAANLPATVSDELKNFHAENPDAITRAYELRKKASIAQSERHSKQAAAQKARRERERIAKMPAMVAKQNLAAAKLPAKIDLSKIRP